MKLSDITADAWTRVAVQKRVGESLLWDWELSEFDSHRLIKMRMEGKALTAQKREGDTFVLLAKLAQPKPVEVPAKKKR